MSEKLFGLFAHKARLFGQLAKLLGYVLAVQTKVMTLFCLGSMVDEHVRYAQTHHDIAKNAAHRDWQTSPLLHDLDQANIFKTRTACRKRPRFPRMRVCRQV